MDTIVTCVTCEQVLTKGRCMNGRCPGYMPSEEEDVAAQERIAALEAENERLAQADGALRELHAQAERWKIPMPKRGDPAAPAVWVLKLFEEVGEVASALLGEAIGKEGRGDVRQELDQVIASALAARAALAQEGRCSCYRVAEISSKEWQERTPCGPHCDALAQEEA